jgi:hypothetical protein
MLVMLHEQSGITLNPLGSSLPQISPVRQKLLTYIIMLEMS